MVGLTGSGKSSVAKELARLLRANVLESNAIRISLRKEKKPYAEVSKIMEMQAEEDLLKGRSVVIDADFIDPKKRKGLNLKAKKTGAPVFYIRTICDHDIMIGRMTTAKADSFFSGASTTFTGNAQSRGATVKIREMWRRTPHHYSWKNAGGGGWTLKKLPFTVLAEIDTTDEKKWKAEVAKVAKRILKML